VGSAYLTDERGWSATGAFPHLFYLTFSGLFKHYYFSFTCEFESRTLLISFFIFFCCTSMRGFFKIIINKYRHRIRSLSNVCESSSRTPTLFIRYVSASHPKMTANIHGETFGCSRPHLGGKCLRNEWTELVCYWSFHTLYQLATPSCFLFNLQRPFQIDMFAFLHVGTKFNWLTSHYCASKLKVVIKNLFEYFLLGNLGFNAFIHISVIEMCINTPALHLYTFQLLRCV
jgi:hypothetical protein